MSETVTTGDGIALMAATMSARVNVSVEPLDAPSRPAAAVDLLPSSRLL